MRRFRRAAFSSWGRSSSWECGAPRSHSSASRKFRCGTDALARAGAGSGAFPSALSFFNSLSPGKQKGFAFAMTHSLTNIHSLEGMHMSQEADFHPGVRSTSLSLGNPLVHAARLMQGMKFFYVVR